MLDGLVVSRGLYTPIRKYNRGISGVERLRTPVAGILTPIRKNIRGIYGVDHNVTAVTDILIFGLQLY
jgi:hypothetical protein